MFVAVVAILSISIINSRKLRSDDLQVIAPVLPIEMTIEDKLVVLNKLQANSTVTPKEIADRKLALGKLSKKIKDTPEEIKARLERLNSLNRN